MARLSKHLRTETTERQWHEPDRHAGCADSPCDDCHRFAGGLFCAECGEHLDHDTATDFCSLACAEAYEKAHPVTDPHEFCDDEPCQQCAEGRFERASMRYDAFTDTLLDIARGGR